MARPVLLDCAPGNDDALGILVACGDPRLDLRAVTTGAGHLASARTAHNAATVLAAIGRRDVPVSAGASDPIVRERLVAQLLDREGGLDFERDDLRPAPLIRATPST